MRLFSALLAIGLVTACGPDELVRHYRDLAAAECTRYYECCAPEQRPVVFPRYTDRGGCEAARREDLDGAHALHAPRVEAGEERFDREAAAACLRATATCGDTAVCARVFIHQGPPRALGSRCEQDAECGAGGCVEEQLGSSLRACRAASAEGSPCSAASPCVGPLYCGTAPASTSVRRTTCLPKKPLGASCGLDEECADGACEGQVCRAEAPLLFGLDACVRPAA
jgi:hypothetical protein